MSYADMLKKVSPKENKKEKFVSAFKNPHTRDLSVLRENPEVSKGTFDSFKTKYSRNYWSGIRKKNVLPSEEKQPFEKEEDYKKKQWFEKKEEDLKRERSKSTSPSSKNIKKEKFSVPKYHTGDILMDEGCEKLSKKLCDDLKKFNETNEKYIKDLIDWTVNFFIIFMRNNSDKDIQRECFTFFFYKNEEFARAKKDYLNYVIEIFNEIKKTGDWKTAGFSYYPENKVDYTHFLNPQDVFYSMIEKIISVMKNHYLEEQLKQMCIIVPVDQEFNKTFNHFLIKTNIHKDHNKL
jgi:hypothetical protein